MSFLDVVAPDESEPIDLHQGLASLKYQLEPADSPVARSWGPWWIRFGNATKIPFQTEVGALAGTMLLRLSGH